MKARMALCAVLAFAQTPLAAQETGTLIPKHAAQVDARGKDAARIVMEAFSSCLVSRAYGRAAKIIDMAVDTPEYGKQLRALFDTMGDECLSGGDLSFNNALLRGTLFQAFYARDFKPTSPTSFDAALQVGYWKRYAEPYSAEAQSSIALENFGECVVRAKGANVQVLVRARAGSPLEDGTFAQLVPTFAPCIAQGSEIRFSKAFLKGVLAEALYRMSVAARNGAVAR